MAKPPGKLFGLFAKKPAGIAQAAKRDDEVRAALARHGDDGTAPRDTVFYFYGGDFEGLGSAARAAGYATKLTIKSDGVILSKDMPVDAASFAATSAQMEAWAQAFGCEYDGWECAVLKKLN